MYPTYQYQYDFLLPSYSSHGCSILPVTPYSVRNIAAQVQQIHPHQLTPKSVLCLNFSLFRTKLAKTTSLPILDDNFFRVVDCQRYMTDEIYPHSLTVNCVHKHAITVNYFSASLAAFSTASTASLSYLTYYLHRRVLQEEPEA